MREVIGGYHCEECGAKDLHDWEEDAWGEALFGIFVFLLVEGGMIFIFFKRMAGG